MQALLLLQRPLGTQYLFQEPGPRIHVGIASVSRNRSAPKIVTTMPWPGLTQRAGVLLTQALQEPRGLQAHCRATRVANDEARSEREAPATRVFLRPGPERFEGASGGDNWGLSRRGGRTGMRWQLRSEVLCDGKLERRKGDGRGFSEMRSALRGITRGRVDADAAKEKTAD